MKFWISLALNVALLAGIAVLAFRQNETGPARVAAAVVRPAPASVSHAPATPTNRSAENAPVAKRKTSDGVAFDLGDGHQIEFPPQFIGLLKQLQEAGISDRSLANFVAAEFNDQWMAWQQDMQRKLRRGEITQAEMQRNYLQYEAARNEAIKATLGDAAYTHWRQENIQRWAQSTGLKITPEQADALSQANKELGASGERGRELSAAMQSGEIDQFDFQEEQAAMQKEFEKKMIELLGADGYAEMKHSSDWQYGQARRQLREMNLPDTQFDAMYDTLQQFGQKQQELSRQQQAAQGDRKDYSQQYSALQQEQEKELQRILGDKGYEQYQKCQDNRYQQLKQYAPAWQLSVNDIDHVYDAVQKAAKELEDYRKEARSNAAGQKVDWNQINQATEDYKRQADSELRSYLGEDRYNKLKRAGLLNLDQQYRGAGMMRFYSGQNSVYIPNF